MPTSGISSSEALNVPTSEPTVEIAYMRPAVSPGVLDAVQLQADRPRRHRAEHQHGNRDEREHAEQRAGEAADRDVVERVDRQRQQRLGDDRHDGEQHRRGEHEHAEAVHVGVPVGEPPAEPVADRERDEHDRDRVRPDDRRVAEERRDQPRGRDLGRRASPTRPRRRATRAAAGGGSPCPIQYGDARHGVRSCNRAACSIARSDPTVPTGCGASVRAWTPPPSPSSTAPTSGTRSPSSAAGSGRRR